MLCIKNKVITRIDRIDVFNMTETIYDGSIESSKKLREVIAKHERPIYPFRMHFKGVTIKPSEVYFWVDENNAVLVSITDSTTPSASLITLSQENMKEHAQFLVPEEYRTNNWL